MVMLLKQLDFDDVIFVERQQDVRIIVSIRARFSSSERRDARGEQRIFVCRAVYLSPGAVAIASPVVVRVGERIVTYIDRIGELKGVVAHVLEGGFVMSIAASAGARAKFAGKIEWLEKHKNHDVLDRRADKRVMAPNPRSRMILPDGNSETCLILNISGSGAAISSETAPYIGAILLIGMAVSCVVRHFEGGFAVKFIKRQSRNNVQAKVMRN
jgi:hypothetical protein